VHVTTPKLLAALDEALRAGRLEDMRRKIDIRSRRAACATFPTRHYRASSAAAEFTPEITREAMEEMLENRAYMTPTYGNTLMGLLARSLSVPHDGYRSAITPPSRGPSSRS